MGWLFNFTDCVVCSDPNKMVERDRVIQIFSYLNHPVCYVAHDKPVSFPLFIGGRPTDLKIKSFNLKSDTFT